MKYKDYSFPLHSNVGFQRNEVIRLVLWILNDIYLLKKVAGVFIKNVFGFLATTKVIMTETDENVKRDEPNK